MVVFVHENGLCESNKVGNGTRIWAFTHVLPGAVIGDDCNVCDNVFIENDVIIGNRVTVKSGVQLWDGVRIGDDVFIGPNATFTNDLFPRSNQHPEQYEQTILQDGCSVGANATILPGITIGMNSMIGAGSVVTKSIPPKAIVVGNPARIVGYVDTKLDDIKNHNEFFSKQSQKIVNTPVSGVTFHTLTEVIDIRGGLSVGEFQRDIPFNVLRYFVVYDVPTIETRGEHAHHKCHQFLISIRGAVHVVADDGENRAEFVLDKPNVGLYLPPMTWGIQYRYSSDAILLVFASDYYDAEDYIRKYEEFIYLVNKGK